MFGKKQQSVYFVNCPERSWQCCLTLYKGPKFVILQSRPSWWWWEGGEGGGVLIMAYTGKLHSKGVPI